MQDNTSDVEKKKKEKRNQRKEKIEVNLIFNCMIILTIISDCSLFVLALVTCFGNEIRSLIFSFSEILQLILKLSNTGKDEFFILAAKVAIRSP